MKQIRVARSSKRAAGFGAAAVPIITALAPLATTLVDKYFSSRSSKNGGKMKRMRNKTFGGKCGGKCY